MVNKYLPSAKNIIGIECTLINPEEIACEGLYCAMNSIHYMDDLFSRDAVMISLKVRIIVNAIH